MAANNLRVIYQNIADTSTITSTSTAASSTATLSTSTILGTVLTVGSVVGTIAVGMYLSGTGVIPGTTILSGSGTSWTVSVSQTVASTTIKAITTATPAQNLQLDAKSLIWRAAATTATLNVTFASSRGIRGIILPFTNLSISATITVTVVGGTGYSTGAVLCSPYAQTDNWDSTYLPQGANSYAYGSGTYARVWFPDTQVCSGVTIVISDTGNTAGYIEASRLVIGDYWSPTFNTSFGLSSSPKDLSVNTRTESGDLVTNRGIRYNSMSFDLSWLNPADRLIFTKILKSNGIAKPLLISLFPDCTEDFNKEQTFQIYGKLSQLSDISHPMFGIYTSNVDIEEV